MSDPTLFRGTASDYDKYRPQYSQEVVGLIKKKFKLDGSGTLLDLGCGTGQLTLPFSEYFEKVIAVDADPEMLRVAKEKAKNQGIENIEWIERAAEDFFPTGDKFKLITIGKAFHWMKQEAIIPQLRDALVPDGGLAFTFGRSWWSGTEEWQKQVIEVVKEFLGNQRRAGAGTFKPSEKKFETMLAEANFKVESFKFMENWDMNIESILGFLYSTSFASRELLVDRAAKFEEKLRTTLLKLNPAGEFISPEPTWVILAWPS
jgi:SAM-dependent methyltransferase